MSEKLYRLARKYAAALNDKQTKIFLRVLTQFPFKQRMQLAWKVFWKIDLVKFTKKENSEIKTGHYLK